MIDAAEIIANWVAWAGAIGMLIHGICVLNHMRTSTSHVFRIGQILLVLGYGTYALGMFFGGEGFDWALRFVLIGSVVRLVAEKRLRIEPVMDELRQAVIK